MTAEEILQALGERHPSVTSVAKFFAYAHLPQHLGVISRLYCELMFDLLGQVTADSAELTVALRKLLESKDAAVRAALG